MDFPLLNMCKLLITNNLRNSAFEISPEKGLKVLTINLLIDIVANLLEHSIQKAILIFLRIILLIIQIDDLIVDVILLIVKVYKLIGGANEEGVVFPIDSEIDVALDVVELDVHQEFGGGGHQAYRLFVVFTVVLVYYLFAVRGEEESERRLDVVQLEVLALERLVKQLRGRVRACF